MTESDAFEEYGAGKIQGKVGSDDQRSWEPFKHSNLNPFEEFVGAKVLP